MTELLGDYIVVEWSGGGGIGHYSYLLSDALGRAGLPTVLATRQGHELEGRVPRRPGSRRRGGGLPAGCPAGCGWRTSPSPGRSAG